MTLPAIQLLAVCGESRVRDESRGFINKSNVVRLLDSNSNLGAATSPLLCATQSLAILLYLGITIVNSFSTHI
jgi:hypothetical protein